MILPAYDRWLHPPDPPPEVDTGCRRCNAARLDACVCDFEAERDDREAADEIDGRWEP